MTVDVRGQILGTLPLDEIIDAISDVSGDPSPRIAYSGKHPSDGLLFHHIDFIDRNERTGRSSSSERQLHVTESPIDSEATGPFLGHEGETSTLLTLGAHGRAMEIVSHLVALSGGYVENEADDTVTEIAANTPTPAPR